MPRYIDAEKIEYKTIMFPVLDGMLVRAKVIENMVERNDIDKIPTADVQEVRYGKWIEDHGWYSHHCSNCNRSTRDYVKEDGDLYDRVFNFCPNCGARMDGDNNDAN